MHQVPTAFTASDCNAGRRAAKAIGPASPSGGDPASLPVLEPDCRQRAHYGQPNPTPRSAGRCRPSRRSEPGSRLLQCRGTRQAPQSAMQAVDRHRQKLPILDLGPIMAGQLGAQAAVAPVARPCGSPCGADRPEVDTVATRTNSYRAYGKIRIVSPEFRAKLSRPSKNKMGSCQYQLVNVPK